MLNYSQMSLDRASNLRKDPIWLAAQVNEQSRWLLVNHNHTLFDLNSVAVTFLNFNTVKNLDLTAAIFLGLDQQDISYFALDVSALEEALLVKLIGDAEFVDIRRYGVQVALEEGSMAALARGLCYWHATHRFCGRCGYQNHLVEGGHSRLCVNEQCKHQTFPRTDPAVIMVVTRTFADGVERCLLGRQAVWAPGMYSSLAGFVDPGETLEQAVAREVMEEAGIIVENVRYIASQPWPFPSSIMLGFIAEAVTEEIQVDKDELDDAQWFSREELAKFGNWHEEGEHLKLPRADSISRYLIDYWRELQDQA
ncbi:NAD(+) diphosphatase [Pseudoalteromonas arctica]|uniref:NAD(+) diphosphatase n=1 Tax=Pseudoalteromonas arctica TaxID=394751 RepID=A0A7Y0DVP1_9GAMM|nr:NAD(+) diphosphatase [Pseudoalteromonas arctica]NMM42445.1 NAD(+) diphosphatase [Pseudoalteromonas arctica]